MKQYDEYQKFMRYKYGYYSFMTLILLIVSNYILGLIFEVQWAQTKELETIIITFITVLFFINISVYHNAYFRKNEDKKGSIIGLLFLGIFNIFVAYQSLGVYPEDFILNGKIGEGLIQFFSGLMFLSIPITYFIRDKIDKKRSAKE
ncbi:MAG: hypothetical protein ABS890_03720 [Carnobacterium inhibens]|jgi:hypothetical protein|uniref:Uncharacterized protein n=1 Tax=Carnobacterium inhibens TaxID=147709 RepID=A0ABR7TGX5_9LACT|nr:hypothetical protein [Carnobacterium inhibens]MBC9826206.1 hypothetical protein [Carnobacterium inhibens]MCM3513439.1 hypothetical protein [Carnobacterium inhibens]